MKREKKTSSELIVDALRTGKELKLSEITELMSQYTGTDIKIQNVSSTMAKLSDSEKTEIGYFISRDKTKRGYVYKLANEAMELSPEQTYGLIRKVGKDRFKLNDALEKVPSLKKYVKGQVVKRTRRVKKNQDKKEIVSEPNQNPIENPPAISFSIESSQTEKNTLPSDPVAMVLQLFKDGNLNVNLNINIRFIGFE